MQNYYAPEETLSINGSHDCSATFVDKNKNIRIFEYERIVKKRYAMFSKQSENNLTMGTKDADRRLFLDSIVNELYNKNIKLVLWHDLGNEDIVLIRDYFPNSIFRHVNHHESHARSSFHLSPFDECLIFSIDGGGKDNGVITYSNVFYAKNENINLIKTLDLNLSWPYNMTTIILSDIIIKPGCLSAAGKLMGLSGYGNVREEWVNYFKEFYKTLDLEKLCKSLNIPNAPDSLSGQIAWDFAKTSQHVFEVLLFNEAKKYIDEYNVDVIMTGGCGLNVLFNQLIYEYLKNKNLKVFVPSIPNDSGLSYGMFLSEHMSKINKDEICFNGYGILDEKTNTMNYKNSFEEFDISKFVEYLKNGKISGILNGYSEVGPRALGNRSIVCYPVLENMKDILNKKVKFREWYRPFAPVCRLEDKDKYFDNAPECKYMSYAPKVKEQYRKLLPSITHVDGTARLQTVTKGCFFYDVLTEMEKQGMIPIILNTSFNIKGYPILTTIEDAFFALNNTELDMLVYGKKIYRK